MNGIHDMGGMHGFGPIPREANEPVFHAGWERRMFAIALAAFARRIFNVDEFRRAIEQIPAADYLRSSYYERWMRAFIALLQEKNIASAEEIETALRRTASGGVAGSDENPHSARRPSAEEPPTSTGAVRPRDHRHVPARFKAGDRVIVRNLNSEHHTRLPRYARGRRGVIRQDWGVFILPDAHAHGGAIDLCHCYSVEFDSRELWGDEHPAGESVMLDLWEPYLQSAAAQRGAASASGKRRTTKPAVRRKRLAKP
jgi:nitrile hydratase beta subunit